MPISKHVYMYFVKPYPTTAAATPHAKRSTKCQLMMYCFVELKAFFACDCSHKAISNAHAQAIVDISM